MLSDSLAKARTAIEADLEERRKIFRHEVSRIKQEMGALGMLGSGPIIERIRKLCESEIEERAQVILKCLLGMLRTDGITLTESLAKGLKDEARKHLSPDPADLVTAYQEVTRGVPEFEKKRPSFARPYSEALTKLDAEINRQAKLPPAPASTAPADQSGQGRETRPTGTPPMHPKTAPSPTPAPPAATSPSSGSSRPQAPAQSVPAPPASAAPGVIPSAAPPAPPRPETPKPSEPAPPSAPKRAMPSIILPGGSTAEARRTAPSGPSGPVGQAAAPPPIPAPAPAESAETEDQKRLAEALAGLRREVAKRSWLGGFPRDEVIQLLDEARAEVTKERPNRFRFSAVGNAIAALPETPAAMRSVYVQLKDALVPFGVNLP